MDQTIRTLKVVNPNDKQKWLCLHNWKQSLHRLPFLDIYSKYTFLQFLSA